VCIRIFGYRDAKAESLAERLGIAFQLTNVIRDVKEDAALGRVYIPQEDLARFNVEIKPGVPTPVHASELLESKRNGRASSTPPRPTCYR